MPIDEGRIRSPGGAEGNGRAPPAPDPIRRAVHMALVLLLLPAWLFVLLLCVAAIVALKAWGAVRALGRAIIPRGRPGS